MTTPDSSPQAESKSERRLAAIMFTDMIGFTALGQRNESLSLKLVDEQRKLIRPILSRHTGKEIKTMGDAFLVEFPNALDAVRCAYDIQRATREFNFSVPEGSRIHLRVGIHLGDVMETDDDISGDAVNIASRIDSLAEDGGVCLTREVYAQVRNRFDVPLVSLGLKSLKNVEEAVEVYKMNLPWEEQTIKSEVPEVRYAKSKDIHIAYQVFGSGPVNLVLTPGILSHLTHYWGEPGWRRWLEGLAKFARIAVFDKRGTGLSDRDAGVPTFEERMDDIRAVMDSTGFDNAVLVGFSDGVGMSVLFAASYPSRTRGLVLYGGEAKGSWAPDHPWEPTNEQFAESLERLERTYGTTEWAERWVSSVAPSKLGDRAFTGWQDELLRLASTPGAAIALWKSNFNMDVRSALLAIHIPTLVIHPTEDKNVDVRGGRYLAEHIPGARLLEFPGRDHWFFVDIKQTDTILREIESFATRLPPPPRGEMRWGTKPRVEAGPRIAVLPLVDMGADARDEYFVDGMTEELITALSQLPNLKVIARTSVMRYKGREKGAAEIGRELGVDSLVEGSVRKASNRVRVSVQLIDAHTEEHLWAQTFDRKLGDIFRLQTEIANLVAKELKLKMIQSSTNVTKQQTSDAEAHTLYLRARYHLNLRTEDGLKEAIRYFEKTIEKDPEYSLALVGLADCYQISALFAYTAPALAYPKARDLAFRALKTGGAQAEVHASFGEFLMHYSYDWAGAARELEQALQINPNYAIAHVWRSSNYAVLGQLDYAFVEARRGLELDPFSVVAMNEVAKNYYYARKFDEAVNEFDRSLRIEPQSAYLHKGLAETYVLQSMLEESTREIEKALAISGRSAMYLDSAACVYAVSNEERKSREVLTEAEKLGEKHFMPSYGRAAAYAALGDKGRALQMLQRSYDDHSWLIWIGVDPMFDPLRKEPAFQSMLKKMNLLHEPVTGTSESSL